MRYIVVRISKRRWVVAEVSNVVGTNYTVITKPIKTVWEERQYSSLTCDVLFETNEELD